MKFFCARHKCRKMSKCSASGKKKVTQQDLRRLMNEQKSKKLVQAPKKIESPLAKYTNSGQLMCIVCNFLVKSESLWSNHIASKDHKNYCSRSKQLRDSTSLGTQTTADTHVQSSLLEISGKRGADFNQSLPTKKLRGILKNAPSQPEEMKNDLDTAPIVMVNTDITALKSSLHSVIPLPKMADLSDPNIKLASTLGEVKKCTSMVGSLPKGFFDDPEQDAKARNIEYKNPVEVEWAKFQREIKEEKDLSAQIIAEDQDIATAERQIDEIDEQMMNWERVMELEQRLEVVKKQEKKEKDKPPSPDDMEFDEFPDWRRKKAYPQ